MRRALPAVTWMLFVACAAPSPAPSGSRRIELPVDLHEARLGFEYSDTAAFGWRQGEGGPELVLTTAASYTPPVRAPQGIALCTLAAFGDFVLDCEVQQSGREYGHRDLCLFFGYRGPSQFGYAHLATSADANAHGIFLVDEAPRRQVTATRSAGVVWGEPTAWHRVRLERQGGRVRVFFDDLTTPVMEADAAPFGPGFVGFGSFDDTGALRALQVVGQEAERPSAAPFASR